MRLLPRTFVLSFFALFCCGLHDQAAAQRMTVDQPDDSFSPQIHVMYILPNDGTDEQLDTNGTIKTSVRAFQNWITGQLGGRQLRLDTFQGDLDMTFVRLTQSDAELSSTGPFVRDQIEQELKAAGFDRSDKIYAVYYGGGSTFACGGGAWPPTLPGNVAALYLKGTPPGAIPCAANSFAPDKTHRAIGISQCFTRSCIPWVLSRLARQTTRWLDMSLTTLETSCMPALNPGILPSWILIETTTLIMGIQAALTCPTALSLKTYGLSTLPRLAMGRG